MIKYIYYTNYQHMDNQIDIIIHILKPKYYYIYILLYYKNLCIIFHFQFMKIIKDQNMLNLQCYQYITSFIYLNN